MAEELIPLDTTVLVTPFGTMKSKRGLLVGYSKGRTPEVTLYIVDCDDGTVGKWTKDEVKVRV